VTRPDRPEPVSWTGENDPEPVSWTGENDLHDLPAALALEVDALCDDFERRWQRDRRRGGPAPDIEDFIALHARSLPPAARLALRSCLADLEGDLRTGGSLPHIPGLALEAEIGRGGMGVVYRARRLDDGRPVALKLIPGAEHARWLRWLAELADLHHPCLVPLESFGSHDGLHFVVMPFVTGGDLKERLGEFSVGLDSPKEALLRAATLTAKVAGAVGFLHRRGILHRDLKPSNILLASPQSREPLVCDFGLAGRLDEGRPPAPAVVGTPPYMAPEQMAGRPLTPAADVWSLGAVLYECLTGRPPFVANGRLEIDRKLTADPTPPRELNLAVDGEMNRLCLGCLSRDPAARPSSPEELAEDLLCYLATTGENP
jgi:serine/threonine-protein kinase